MQTAFEVLAEPKRRLILDLLKQGELPVGELVRKLKMSQPLVSKHLRVLREAGLVSARIDAQRRVYSLDPRPLKEIEEWIAQYRPFWTSKLDALEQHLGPKESGKE